MKPNRKLYNSGLFSGKQTVMFTCLVMLVLAGSMIIYSFTMMDTKKSLTSKEMADGWMLLFDGKTFNGWRGYGKDSFPETGWTIENGTLKCKGSKTRIAGEPQGGDIIYDRKFGNFHLKIEWKISEGGNSGIFYLGQESPQYKVIWLTAPEMQILDNERHPDANAGKNGNRKAGSLYDLIAADPQNTKPAGEWNTVDIVVKNGHVTHYQNGAKIVEYQLWSPEWNELVAASKFPSLNANWARVASEGYIGLQDHGDDVWFRNIRIRQ
jgi:hypothetical protein